VFEINWVGQTLGNYTLLSKIGQGGMAVVYQAYEPALDRYVAIKILPPLLASDPGFAARFENEAKAIAKLNHPNILPIYNFGQQSGISYLVMRFIQAGTLKDRMGQPLEFAYIAEIIHQIADALNYAHENGIVHRDIKPSNILMANEHWPLLTDFGLAKMMESAAHLTATGVGIGTPAYMSPEQGQGLAVDRRTDIYSLGIMLYEMVIGKVPYEAETPMGIVLKHISAPLPLPTQARPDLPPAVENVLLKALAKRPEDRFQTAADFTQALDTAILQGSAAGLKGNLQRESVSPLPSTAAPSQAELPAQETVAAGEAVLEPTLVPPAPQKASNLPTRPAFEPRAAAVPPPSRSLLTRIRFLPKLRSIQWPRTNLSFRWMIGILLVGLLVIGSIWILLERAPGINGRTSHGNAPIPASGQYTYFTSDQSGKAEIYYLDPRGQVHRVTYSPGVSKSWSPASGVGGLVYFASDQSGKTEVYFLDSKGKIHQVTFTPGGYESWSPAPAVNGYVYFTSDQSGKAEIYYLDSKGQVHRVTYSPGVSKSWSPAPAVNGYVYFTSDQSGKAEIYFLNPKGQVHRVTYTSGSNESWSPAPAANGYVYFTSDQSGKAEIYFLDPKGQTRRVTYTPGLHQSWSPAPAANGYVYFTSDQNNTAEVYYLDPKGQVHRVTYTPGSFESWSFLSARPEFVPFP
jgi:serine/threonine protein kinase/catechol 2,3-dioxygenase-like lactoylglutathione lyase family enzyme